MDKPPSPPGDKRLWDALPLAARSGTYSAVARRVEPQWQLTGRFRGDHQGLELAESTRFTSRE